MSQDSDDLSYSDLLLGDSMERILAATDSAIPRVPESVFIKNVLPLLERPFYHASMVNYTRYVQELTNPLRVTSDTNPNQVLFEVPPFIQTTGVTLPAKGAPTTDTTMRNLYAEADRGADVNRMISTFMHRVTARPDLRKTLLDPLQEILSRYGKTLDISDEKNQIETGAALPGTPAAAAKAVDVAGDDSFTGEYE